MLYSNGYYDEAFTTLEKYKEYVTDIKRYHEIRLIVFLNSGDFQQAWGEFKLSLPPTDDLNIENLEILLNRWGKKALFYGSKDEFKRIAILGGSGSIGVEFALKNKSDLFITGELDYHELIQAREEGLSILLLGHGASEAPVLNNLLEIMPIEAQIAAKPYLVTL
jgi:hypothetical protein